MAHVEVCAQAYFIRAGHLSVNGGQTQAEVKCWHHGDAEATGETLLWEVRRLTDAIHDQQPMTRNLHQWLWERRDGFAAACDQFGFDWAEELVPSRNAVKARRKRGAEDIQHHAHQLHDEFTVTTVGMVLMLWYCSIGLKSTSLRSKSSGLLAAIMTATLPLDGIDATVGLLQVDHSMAALCGLRGRQEGACAHIEKVLEDSCKPNQAPQQHVCNLARALLLEAAVCPACSACAKPFLKRIASIIDKGVPEAAYTSDATRATSVDADLPQGCKKRRVDEDFKKAVLRDVMHDGRAPSSRVFLRAVEGPQGADRCKRWEETDALHYQSASWMSFGGAGSITVSIDATRLGKPGEDTEVGFFYSAEARQGCWLPPQVLSLALRRARTV
jgi:hypothetical protein